MALVTTETDSINWNVMHAEKGEALSGLGLLEPAYFREVTL